MKTEEDKAWFPDIAGKDWLETLHFAMQNFKDDNAFVQRIKIIRDKSSTNTVNENDFIEAYWIISNGKEVDEVFSKKWKSN